TAQTLADTRTGERVRLVIHDSLRQGVFQRRRQDVIGHFVRANPDSVWIRPLGASDLGVARTAIARASVSSGASRWKSALLLGVGWGLGMAAAVAFSDENTDDGHRGRDIWIGAGVGVGAGMVVGAKLPFELWRGVKP
ncbi:MAG: hypothetical protein JNK74_30605, partial [Candidatus Hydrogenedentes bacterium]|nr:hypothetical protein [Candidatus Hydrogenedentota bacterium]